MRPLERVVGRALPLDRRDVDTDQIIPSDWLKRTERTGYGAGLFAGWCADPAFVLNDPRHAGATILLAGANFGCGSSREHAAWALEDRGFRAIVAPSFADIFRGNCRSVGIVTAELAAADVGLLLAAVAADPALEIEVDLRARTVRAAAIGYRGAFAIDEIARARLLAGQDEIDVTIGCEAEIARHEAGRPAWLPRLRVAG